MGSIQVSVDFQKMISLSVLISVYQHFEKGLKNKIITYYNGCQKESRPVRLP